ncbi:MAG: helix-turn-helix domain-containing protein [Chloroflexales bacterium]|nr:helix-turn-helix domain-containing protein [Chloroflexales bacterium]
MNLDADICYRAIQTRDARFDGQFFTAVRTTKVYCRPLCPAPTPKRENCTFYVSAAAAQEAGYRPCLRCRPELAPDLAAALGPDGIVARMLRLIADGTLDDDRIGVLARRLGVTERHLRRLCVTHLGAAPIAIAQTRRLLFAKQLIDETNLPLTEVALAAGFGSIRRFNAVFHATYGRPPSALRRNRQIDTAHTVNSGITLKLPFSPPYHWDALIGFLAARSMASVEDVRPDAYRRTIALAGAHGVIEVRPVAGQPYLLATIWFGRIAVLDQIMQRLRRLFDLGAAPALIANQLACDPLLAPLVAALPGLRVPGAWEPFELAVRAILGQQISVAGARTLAGRLVAAFGEPFALDGVPAAAGLHRIFPTSQALATADLTSIGLPRARATALRALASAVSADPQFLHSGQNLDTFVERLCTLPGIGPWTAHYIALRAVGEPDAFPATDLGLLRALRRLGAADTTDDVIARAEAWRPWRAYAALYLWHSLATLT